MTCGRDIGLADRPPERAARLDQPVVAGAVGPGRRRRSRPRARGGRRSRVAIEAVSCTPADRPRSEPTRCPRAIVSSQTGKPRWSAKPIESLIRAGQGPRRAGGRSSRRKPGSISRAEAHAVAGVDRGNVGAVAADRTWRCACLTARRLASAFSGRLSPRRWTHRIPVQVSSSAARPRARPPARSPARAHPALSLRASSRRRAAARCRAFTATTTAALRPDPGMPSRVAPRRRR